jgi:membrane dipeptidase
MNRIGMMIDVSHISDQAFYQVIALSKTPVIASHSSLRRFTPGFERNMDEPMVKVLAQKGGVIMINFGSGFLSAEARQWRDQLSMARNRLIQEEGDASPKLATFEEDYTARHPYPFSTLAQVLDHIDYVANLVGIDYVGLGSDFDGVGNTLPEGLKDVSMYPLLIQGLLDRGYAEDGIKKILGGNLLRVWKAVEDFAASNAP